MNESTREQMLTQMYAHISTQLRILSTTNRDIINSIINTSDSASTRTLYNIYCRNMQMCNTYNNQINIILNAIVTAAPAPVSVSHDAPLSTSQPVNIRTTYYRQTANGLTPVGNEEQRFTIPVPASAITTPTSTSTTPFGLLELLALTAINNHASEPEVATPEQINAAINNPLYGEIETPINTECPITQETFEPTTEVSQIRHCGHVFMRPSLAQWLQRSCVCPTCRYDIRGSNTGNSTPSSGATSTTEETDASRRLFSSLFNTLLSQGDSTISSNGQQYTVRTFRPPSRVRPPSRENR